MLLFMLLLSILFAWTARRVASFRNQRAAIGLLQRRGEAIARFSFGNVQALQLTGNHDDESLRLLVDLPELTVLDAPCRAITNDGLRCIGRKKSLRILSLVGTSIDDDGLKHLAGLDDLAVLWLNKTAVTEGGVQILRAELPNCDIRYGATFGPR